VDVEPWLAQGEQLQGRVVENWAGDLSELL